MISVWDKLDLRVPFDEMFVSEISVSNSTRRGCVLPQNYDFPLTAQVAFVDGHLNVTSSPQAQKWGSISSGISSVAVGFFPEGNGFYPWPHISLKASPSKILQGHNVFGTENIRHGAMQMISTLRLAFPKIYAHLDIENSEIRYLDATYSARVENEYQRNHIIKFFEKLFPNKNDINRHEGYLQANKSSEYFRQKFYYKLQELLADLAKAKQKGQRDRVAILSEKRLHDFAYGLLRFEATIGHRALSRLGIPTNLKQFLKFHDWFQSTHNEPLSRYLWHKAFDKIFSQLEGHTMKNVDDNHIKLKIDTKFIRYKENGKVCKRKANAIFRTYRDIKRDGYDALAKERSSTFFDNVKCMIDAGISRAFLKSLDPNKPNENVIPFVQVINVDFSHQRPSWYIEPTSGFSESSRHLKLVS